MCNTDSTHRAGKLFWLLFIELPLHNTPPMTRLRCVICSWRRSRIGGEHTYQVSADEAPLDECDSESLAIRRSLHTYPGPTWTAIIDTGMLSHCNTPTTRNGRLWVCIPLRMPEQHSWLEHAHCYWDYEGKTYSCKERVVAYHNCHIHSLVSSTNCWGT